MNKIIIISFCLLAMLAPAASFAKPRATVVLPPVVKPAVVKKIVPAALPPRSVVSTSTVHQPQSVSRPATESFVLTGEVIGVTTSSQSVEVKIKTINHLSSRRLIRGTTVSIGVTAATAVKHTGLRRATVSNLAVGNLVTVRGKLQNGLFTASSIVAAGKPAGQR